MAPVRPESVRVTHTDRQRVADQLAVALSEGSLDLGEFDSRTTAAYAAVTRGDLGALTADLPPCCMATTRAPDRRGHREAWLGVLRAVTTLWLMISASTLLVWGLACIGNERVLDPAWIWVTGPAGTVLAALWFTTDHRS